jgi:leucyl-tRNA synthetase
LSSYGTGAVMAVPAHDERDFAFAKKYKLEEKLVIIQPAPLHGSQELRPYTGEGYLTNSEKYNSLPSWEARKAIVLQLEKEGKAKFKKNYRLHDWILSRQRYWGCPIPMIHCADCGYVPVPEQDLPVILPRLEDYRPAEDGRSPLAKAHEWVEVKCPQCGKDAQRETDTMDTFVDSSWYFLRYTDPQNQDVIADSEKANVWLPVQKYIGGAEHNTMHLLYARFFTKAMNDCGIVDFDEPFLSRVNHGVILGPDGQKMSKSKGNVIDPDELVKEYGADVVRMYLAFMAPYEQGGPWDPKGIKGVARFLDRAWKFAHEYEKIQDGSQHSRPILHNAIKQLGEDIANFHFNTCVSELMKLINHLEVSVVDREVVEIFVKLLAPFAPHMAEELWQNVLEHADSVHIQLWPEYKEELLQENEVSIVVQINGKPRAVIGVPFGAEQDRVGEIARKDEKAIKYLEGTTIAKEIFVKNKLINFVIQKEGESK